MNGKIGKTRQRTRHETAKSKKSTSKRFLSFLTGKIINEIDEITANKNQRHIKFNPEYKRKQQTVGKKFHTVRSCSLVVKYLNRMTKPYHKKRQAKFFRTSSPLKTCARKKQRQHKRQRQNDAPASHIITHNLSCIIQKNRHCHNLKQKRADK